MFTTVPSLGRRFFYSHLICALAVGFSVASYLFATFRTDLIQNNRAQLEVYATQIAERLPDYDLSSPKHTQALSDALQRLATRYRLGTVLLSQNSGSLRLGVQTDPEANDLVLRSQIDQGKWNLELRSSGHEQTRRLNEIRNYALLGFVGAVGMALLLAGLLTRETDRLLKDFSDRFAQMGAGNFSVRLPRFADAKLNAIGMAFNTMGEKLSQGITEREKMLEQLKRARDQLEQNVKDRSRELEKLNEILRQEHEQRAILEATLAEAAATDSLTKLLNRRSMQELIQDVSKKLVRQGASSCFATLDIDHFKQINDRFGHAVGDEVLAKISQLLRKNSRNDEAAARWGGEEFLLFWPEQSLLVAERRAEHMRELIAEQSFAGGQLKVTVSIGLAEWDAKEKLEEALKRSDKALYQAKSEGRNRVKTQKSNL